MFQGITDYVWLSQKRFVVSWLKSPDGETVWEAIAPSCQEDKRVDLYDSIVNLLEEVKKRNIKELTLIIDDHIVFNHLTKTWVPRKVSYQRRYDQVQNLLASTFYVAFDRITVKEQKQANMLLHEWVSDDDEDYNNPDLVMISFL
ncbi:hypothetical protein EMIT07CA2_550056 [Brevibacillus sp. IT-7CA2]|uniref:hypothetical protein n=1 Tax=Brevibacillus sp. IT-7CA2 TaxID=3026436 RepID=UPI0039E1F816